MDWSIIANLIINIGVPATEKLIKLWESKAEVTLAEFQSVRSSASENVTDEATSLLKSAGIDPASPQAVALLKLVS